ncbi:MAG: hypothetical protein ACJ8BF_08915 [Gemmatimonadales bacterium]
MTSPLGAADFFALEAGECLDRLENLVNDQAAPPADEFLRLSRVLRGSALMAGQAQIARAAAGLEVLARAQRAHRRSWDAATREQVAQSVEEFRLLVRQSRAWTEADTARAVRLGRELEALSGSSGTEAESPPRPHEGERPDLHTGVRAFVAREGALIASALDRAARALRVSPGDREPLYNVIRRMQSLRGLAELGELAPLPDILDGVELAVGDLTRLFAPPPGVDEVMDAAAQALTRISRDVAEHGRPDPEAAEASRFTELLLRAFAVERDVVPIESLYFEGDREPLTRPAAQPQFASPEPLGPLELVSHGEHLCQSADLIAAAGSATERDLRLYHLLGTLRSAAVPSGDPIGGALGVFAKSAQEALAAGVASHSIDGLLGRMREAGQLLRAVVESDDRMLISRRLLDVAHRMDGLRSQVQTAESRPAALEPSGEPVPIESLGFEEEQEIVPVESLAPDAPAQRQPRGLEQSFRTYHRLKREQAPAQPSIPALLGKAARDLPAVGAATSKRGPAPEEPAVAIDTLCYRGHAALERAIAVRHQIAAELTRDPTLESLQPLLQELLDLVPRALADS